MEYKINNVSQPKISLLVVDDSRVFRKFISDVLEDCEGIEIIGEAENGITALDMVLKKKPDVILLDVEMPLMDGMIALQHLMIHRPTPTIMCSSLTSVGTARCFDTIKNGAVDFICKDFIFHESNLQTYKELLVSKIRRASRMAVSASEPVSAPSSQQASLLKEEKRVVFCEECGHREAILLKNTIPINSIICSNCGDTFDLELAVQKQYRRNTFVTVIGCGEGSFFNLLQIIPQFEPEMGGAIIIVLHGTIEHLNSFTEYLDAVSKMSVIRAKDGMTIEGGKCYISSGFDCMSLKPYSAQLTLQRVEKMAANTGPVDMLFASSSTVMRKRLAAVVLSGIEDDGDKGMNLIIKNNGTPVVLDPAECYCKRMSQHILLKCNISKTYRSGALVAKIKSLHYEAKGVDITG